MTRLRMPNVVECASKYLNKQKANTVMWNFNFISYSHEQTCLLDLNPSTTLHRVIRVRYTLRYIDAAMPAFFPSGITGRTKRAKP